jgi:hypothetical protein
VIALGSHGKIAKIYAIRPNPSAFFKHQAWYLNHFQAGGLWG